MSMSYWMIRGLGFSMDKISEHLDAERILEALGQKEPPISAADIENWSGMDNAGRLHALAEFQNVQFGFADIIGDSDPLNLLSYGNDGECGSYLFYEPCLPWEMREHECKTEQAARDHICDVVMPFMLPGTDRNRISEAIESLDEVGAG